MPIVMETNLPYPLFCRGKVRDTYLLDGDLLIVATDRISAFDVVLPCGIPDKGLVLNRLSAFWFEKIGHLVPHHLIEVVEDTRLLAPFIKGKRCYVHPKYLAGRSMIVRKAERIPVECVVRGYISGSAWAEYRQNGTINGIPLPPGLKESEQLTEPVFTPTTKAEGEHDRPLTREQLRELIGKSLSDELEEKSLAIYCFAEEYARARGIIVADTKMEFGLVAGKLILIDELLTPDSSRFWNLETYQPGYSQPSFDKQPVRDWLVASGWNKEPPAPMLPTEIIQQTAARYREAYHRLSGRTLRQRAE